MTSSKKLGLSAFPKLTALAPGYWGCSVLYKEAEAKCKGGEVEDSETHSPRENMKEKGNEGNPEKRQHIKKKKKEEEN